MPEFDLVDEMQWEDLADFIQLADAGLENPPEHDTVNGALHDYFVDESGADNA